MIEDEICPVQVHHGVHFMSINQVGSDVGLAERSATSVTENQMLKNNLIYFSLVVSRMRRIKLVKILTILMKQAE